jgi:hypothetical protein
MAKEAEREKAIAEAEAEGEAASLDPDAADETGAAGGGLAGGEPAAGAPPPSASSGAAVAEAAGGEAGEGGGEEAAAGKGLQVGRGGASSGRELRCRALDLMGPARKGARGARHAASRAGLQEKASYERLEAAEAAARSSAFELPPEPEVGLAPVGRAF